MGENSPMISTIKGNCFNQFPFTYHTERTLPRCVSYDKKRLVNFLYDWMNGWFMHRWRLHVPLVCQIGWNTFELVIEFEWLWLKAWHTFKVTSPDPTKWTNFRIYINTRVYATPMLLEAVLLLCCWRPCYSYAAGGRAALYRHSCWTMTKWFIT